MAAAGAAVILPDSQLTGQRLAAEVRSLLDRPAALQQMAAASLALAKPNAAQEVAEELLAAASRGRSAAASEGS